MGKRWTPEEDAILIRNYPKTGAAGVERNLARHGYTRSRNAIGRRAEKLGIYSDDMPGHVPAAWTATCSQPGCIGRAVEVARRAGVLKTVGGRVKHFVPQEWADEVIAEREARQANNDLEGWLTTACIAQTLDTTDSSVRRMLHRGPLARAFQGVEERRGFNPPRRLFHPRQAAEAVARYIARRS